MIKKKVEKWAITFGKDISCTVKNKIVLQILNKGQLVICVENQLVLYLVTPAHEVS